MAAVDLEPKYIPDHIRAWAAERRVLLERLVSELKCTGGWPDLSELTRALAGEGQPQDVRGILWHMPRPLGWIDHNPERAQLTVFGLRLTEGGWPLLEGVVRVLRLAVDRYPKGGDEAMLRRGDLPLLIDAELVGVLSGVIWSSTPFLLFQGDPAGEWTAAIDASVVRYWNAETVDEYLCIRADEFKQSPQGGWGAVRVDAGSADSSVDEDVVGLVPAIESGMQVGVVRGDREWELRERIGDGGFGMVFAAHSGDTEAVVKLVPKAPGASRELLFAELDNVPNIVPIWDQGEYGGYWFLVMPRATRSLRDALAERGRFSVEDGVAVLVDIADALVGLDGRVVHRDLKPENVLELNGRWCLADFGIARYAEATTATETRKGAMSLPYAAPERFRGERAGAAADVYSVGVIGYELLTGELPFRGSSPEDFQDAHLHDDPPDLEGVPVLLAALVTECLYKSSGARPTPANLRARLERAANAAPSGGLARLSDANMNEVQRLGRAGSQQAQAMTAAQRRQVLQGDAARSLRRISDALLDTLVAAAPAARVQRDPDVGSWRLEFGRARLEVSTARPPSAGWDAAGLFDLVAVTEIGLRMPSDRYGFSGRSHSLWFADAQAEGEYVWFETGFSLMALMASLPDPDPFALDGGQDARMALLTGVHTHVVVWPFTPLRLGELNEFASRWGGWLADAAEGRLQRVPGDGGAAVGSWRRS